MSAFFNIFIYLLKKRVKEANRFRQNGIIYGGGGGGGGGGSVKYRIFREKNKGIAKTLIICDGNLLAQLLNISVGVKQNMPT